MKMPLPTDDELKYETELESIRVCPFCGTSPGRLVYHMDVYKPKFWKKKNVKVRYSVWCPKCGIETKTYQDQDSAIRSWNVRYQRTSIDLQELSEIPFIDKAEWLTNMHTSIGLIINGKGYTFNKNEMTQISSAFNYIRSKMEMDEIRFKR